VAQPILAVVFQGNLALNAANKNRNDNPEFLRTLFTLGGPEGCGEHLSFLPLPSFQISNLQFEISLARPFSDTIQPNLGEV